MYRSEPRCISPYTNGVALLAKQGHGCRLEILHAGQWGTITDPQVMLLKLAFCPLGHARLGCGRIIHGTILLDTRYHLARPHTLIASYLDSLIP